MACVPAQVVMKDVNLHGLSGKDLKSAKAEVDVLKKLRHPNIIAYRDSFTQSSTLCIIMEYAAGGDLGSAIKKKNSGKQFFSEPEAIKILYQCVDALAYCHHELHLVSLTPPEPHRNLQPANALLTLQLYRMPHLTLLILTYLA